MSAEQSLARLLNVIDRLLGPDGCPCDREQTPESLCDYVIEESYELIEAIRADQPDDAREELGDVLFLLAFIAVLFERRGDFSLADVIENNAAKMIRRHPHVFADASFENQKELLQNWERIKREEKNGDDGKPARVFASLPKGLPPLLRAYRIQAKAARLGFTWEKDGQVEEQLRSEWEELREAQARGDKAAIEEEFGDYLFTLVEYGRRMGIKANAALDAANRKFLRRFERMEDLAEDAGQDVPSLDLAALNALWDRAKAGDDPSGKAS
ncbi:nucleoside triphosphate pyrophosphohydrolase [Desulfovibrio sp.]